MGRWLVFLTLLGGMALWIGSGMLLREPLAPAPPPERRPMVVAAAWSEAADVERVLTLYGEVVPNQIVRLRAQTAGQVDEVLVGRGAVVEAGEAVARLDLADRPARERGAEARVANAQRDHDAAERLAAQGVAPRARVEATLAELEAARSALATIRAEIENTVLRAPIAGVVNRIMAEAGDFLAVGGEALEIVDNRILRAVVQVPQHSLAGVRPGGEARVSLVGRAPVAGVIRFVAPLAEAATRTFRVEIELSNPDGALPSGVSAEVVIPIETVRAHRISPALIALDDGGRIGVHAVGDDGVVLFHPIALVRARADAVWVGGLPERLRLITIRPGFVTAGQRVEAREAPQQAPGSE